MHTDKSIGVILSETKAELKEFFETRLQILQAEVREKVRAWKSSLPLLLIAAAFLLMGWAALTFSLIALLQAWFLPSAYSWLWAALIVAAAYMVAGIALGWLGYRAIKSVGMSPKRTLEVLKQDQVWIQNEARTA
ncbi:MAG TPA: phage holin family protein [Candidatus Solibacter sp.]|nr:phage holin family protein [Candidatus Solibacter sp.]